MWRDQPPPIVGFERLDDDPPSTVGQLELMSVVGPSGDVVDHVVLRTVGTPDLHLFEGAAIAGRLLSAVLNPGLHELLTPLLADAGRPGGRASASFSVRGRAHDLRLEGRPDGRIVWLHTRPVPSASASAATAGNTPADERIHRLRLMLSAVDDTVALYEPVLDANGDIVDFLCLEVSDVDPLMPPEEQVGRRLLELYPETVENSLMAGYLQAMIGGVPWTSEPVRYERDGQRYAYAVRAQREEGLLLVVFRDTLLGDASVAGDPLTRRQLEIIGAIAAGRPTADIAADQYLSTNTVRNEVRRIMSKLGVRTRAEAVSTAIAQGLLSPPPTDRDRR